VRSLTKPFGETRKWQPLGLPPEGLSSRKEVTYLSNKNGSKPPPKGQTLAVLVAVVAVLAVFGLQLESKDAAAVLLGALGVAQLLLQRRK
jgi:hypothetical protein